MTWLRFMILYPSLQADTLHTQSRIKVFWGPRLDTIVGPYTHPYLPSSPNSLNQAAWSSEYHHQKSLKLHANPIGAVHKVYHTPRGGQRCVTVCDRGPVMRDVTLQTLKN